MRSPWSAVLVFAALAACATGGCAKAQARTQPEGPALDAPVPPARMIAPVELEAEPAASTTDDAPAPTLPRQPNRSTAGRTDPPREGTGAKPEPPKLDPVKEPEGDASQLRTVPSGSDAELERGIRDQLSHASRDLGRVNYNALTPDAKEQYDTAKRFVQQATDALKAKNFVFARNLADKAAALAAVLLGG